MIYGGGRGLFIQNIKKKKQRTVQTEHKILKISKVMTKGVFEKRFLNFGKLIVICQTSHYFFFIHPGS